MDCFLISTHYFKFTISDYFVRGRIMRSDRMFSKITKTNLSILTAGSLILSGYINQDHNDSTMQLTLNTEKKNHEFKLQEKPNIIYIILDDSGYSDIGSYGSEIKTPNIDLLAENGIRFSNSHVSPVSSPTRAALLTGRNPHAVGMGMVANFDLDFPSKQGRIIDEAGTIAEVLKEEGYNNYAVGKWHLAPSHQLTAAGPYNYWPLNKGFDKFYGILEDSTDQYKPDLVMDNTFIEVPKDPEYHFSEAIVEHANQYIIDQASVNSDQPFFLNLAFGAQHQPVQVPQSYKDMYKGVYDKGWDEIRKERFERQIEMGLIPVNTPFPERDPGVPEWNSLSKKEKEVFIEFQEAYAGFLTHTDEQIGKLIDTLKRTNEFDETLFVFLSDNGASPLGGQTGSINHTLNYNMVDEDFENIYKQKKQIGSVTTKAEYPLGWAQVSNTPFTNYKASLFEGGIRTPLIISYPKEIPVKNEIRHNYTYVTDVTATIYDLLNITVPETINGIKQMDLNGISFVPSLFSEETETRKTQYYEVSGTRAIYSDGWKAISIHKKGEDFEKDKWMLFNVKEDITETKNLANENKEKLAELLTIFDQEAKANNLYPLSDIQAEGFSYVAKGSNRDKEKFVYYQGANRIAEGATPMLLNNSYEITIPIERTSSDQDGVLVSLGSYESGYTLFIKDNQLHYVYNRGDKQYNLVSKEDVPLDKSVVKLKFTKGENFSGTMHVSIDNNIVGELLIEQTHFVKMSFEGFEVGKDTGFPVSPIYAEQGEFEFKGLIEKVEINLVN